MKNHRSAVSVGGGVCRSSAQDTNSAALSEINCSPLKIVFEIFAYGNHSVVHYEGRFYNPRGRYHRLLKKLLYFRLSLENLQDQEMGFNKTLRKYSLIRGIPFFLSGGVLNLLLFFVRFLVVFFVVLDVWNRDSFGCT